MKGRKRETRSLWLYRNLSRTGWEEWWDTRQGWSQGAVAAVLQKEPAKGSWYMADFIETSDLWRRRSKGETSSRAEPWQRKRNCISAYFCSRFCCQYNLACHTLCLFLDWVKHIAPHEVRYRSATKRNAPFTILFTLLRVYGLPWRDTRAYCDNTAWYYRRSAQLDIFLCFTHTYIFFFVHIWYCIVLYAKILRM